MWKRATLVVLALASSNALAAPSMSWNADEKTHVLLLQKGLAGKSLAAVEDVLAAEGFHVTTTRLAMAGSGLPALRQGTLTVVYETTPPHTTCARRAPCRHVGARRVLIELACDQSIGVGTNPPPECDWLRGLDVLPQ